MKNRIKKILEEKSNNIVSVFFTAGYPNTNDTNSIINQLIFENVDIIEIGIPFSDPIADGIVIQKSSKQAIDNGMNIALLLEQLKDIRNKTQIPIILMGYLNPIMKYGEYKFFKEISKIGIDGLIIPDLPLDYYLKKLKPYYIDNNIFHIGLVTPSTTEERIKLIDKESNGFIYVVSTHGITGSKYLDNNSVPYFDQLKKMNLKNPFLVGFGISNRNDIVHAFKHSNGIIIGSSFIDALNKSGTIKQNITNFFKKLNHDY